MRTEIGPRGLEPPSGLTRHFRIIVSILAVLGVVPGAVWAQGIMTRVSVGPEGTQGNDVSGAPALSADGRFVAFHSSASNLVTGDTNGTSDVFVHDRVTGTTTRVSVSTGSTQGNGGSYDPALSADGRYVAFCSDASNLVVGDTNGRMDVFVHDRQEGTTTRASVGPEGTQGNDASGEPELSADGRFVAFHSSASNLVTGDTNGSYDVFVHDRDTSTTTRVSVSTGGTQGNGGSYDPALSADGRYVAFCSDSSNLVVGDTNGRMDVFVHDRQEGTTTRVSMLPGGVQGNNPSYGPALGADGRFVAFAYWHVENIWGAEDIFVHDRETGTTTEISAGSNDGSSGPALSADGRFVAFVHYDYYSGWWTGDVFVHDRETDTTALVLVGNGDGYSWSPALSADGRFVAFASDSTNLVADDTNGAADVFLRDGTVVGKSIPSNGAVGTATALVLQWIPPWNPSSPLASYEYCYDAINNDTCDGTWTAATGTEATITGLDVGANYYWQVRAGTMDADGGAWWPFTTAPLPGAFGKSAPLDGATQQTVPLTLAWNASSDATFYEYCYDTIDNRACDGTWSSLTGTTQDLTVLTGDTTYYWQVRAGNAAGTTDADGGNWSSFTTGPLPGRFGKVSPPRESIGQTNPLTLSWATSTGATSYEYCYDQLNNNTCDGTWISVTGTTQELTGIGTSYYFWQIRARNSAGITYADDGTWWKFTMADPPQSFGKYSPTNGATQQTGPLKLSWVWSNLATSYEYCYDTVNNNACDGTWTSVTAREQSLTGLTAGTTYYWQVRSRNAAGMTYADGGTWWAFTTAALPAVFGKSSPTNGTTEQLPTLTLGWLSSSGATSYEYCYDTTANDSCDGSWTPVTDTNAAIVGLESATTYYWQVRARSAAGTTEANVGTWWAFTTRRPAVASPDDLNGDGRMDIVLQHRDGWLAVWFMEGTRLLDGAMLNPSYVDPAWKIVGTGDANADGKADIYWQHDDGRLAVWYMDGWNLVDGAQLNPARVPDGWQVRAVGDLNNDGKPDLILQHVAGGLAVWYMDGLNIVDGTYLTPNSLDPAWHIVGTGDVDSDGKLDLVLQNQTNGSLAVWFMDGAVLVDGTLISPSRVEDQNWRVRGVGDLNGDGRPDLLWQHTATGDLAGWIMNGAVLVDGAVFAPPNPGEPRWRIVGPR